MSADRDRLVMALRTHPDLPVLHPGSDRIADALLPVVERIRAEAKAEVWSLAASWVGPPFADEFEARAAAQRAGS